MPTGGSGQYARDLSFRPSQYCKHINPSLTAGFDLFVSTLSILFVLASATPYHCPNKCVGILAPRPRYVLEIHISLIGFQSV